MSTFDPAPYLVEVNGTTVLSLSGRLAWLRHEYQGAEVVTEEKWHEPLEWASFRATVSWPGVDAGTGVPESATAHGMARASDGHDYYEAAERRALTHVLIAFGIGTEYPFPIDYLTSEATTARMRSETTPPLTPVPAPPQNRQDGGSAPQSRPSAGQQGPAPRVQHPNEPITDRQLGAINAVAYKLGRSGAEVIAECEREFGIGPSGLTKGQASRYIDMLNNQLKAAGG